MVRLMCVFCVWVLKANIVSFQKKSYPAEIMREVVFLCVDSFCKILTFKMICKLCCCFLCSRLLQIISVAFLIFGDIGPKLERSKEIFL